MLKCENICNNFAVYITYEYVPRTGMNTNTKGSVGMTTIGEKGVFV